MEQNHFMQNIEETYHSLTKVEKKVADYVLQNPRQVLFINHDILVAKNRKFCICSAMLYDPKLHEEDKI